MAELALERLRLGRPVSDAAFDALYPTWVQRLSAWHWTPVAAARRAAALLVARPGARVLDVGAGAGKLCLVGALTTKGLFTGVERRARLVTVARRLAERHQVARCRFVAGDFAALDFRRFDAFFLYNPFAENLPQTRFLDDGQPRSRALYRTFVREIEERLDAAATGTRLVTLHGFGGVMPPGWRRALHERPRAGPLSLWIKERG